MLDDLGGGRAVVGVEAGDVALVGLGADLYLSETGLVQALVVRVLVKDKLHQERVCKVAVESEVLQLGRECLGLACEDVVIINHSQAVKAIVDVGEVGKIT